MQVHIFWGNIFNKLRYWSSKAAALTMFALKAWEPHPIFSETQLAFTKRAAWCSRWSSHSRSSNSSSEKFTLGFISHLRRASRSLSKSRRNGVEREPRSVFDGPFKLSRNLDNRVRLRYLTSSKLTSTWERASLWNKHLPRIRSVFLRCFERPKWSLKFSRGLSKYCRNLLYYRDQNTLKHCCRR